MFRVSSAALLAISTLVAGAVMADRAAPTISAQATPTQDQTTLDDQVDLAVTVYNSDQLLHRIVADDGSFDTGAMTPRASFSVTAGKPGTTISYRCLLHTRVRGQIVVDPPPVVPSATGLTLSSPTSRVGGSYSVTFTGSNLDATTYFDVRFRAPDGTVDLEAFNWQQGVTASHDVVTGTASGRWTIVGIRSHKDVNDHVGSYVPVSVVLTITPF